jgi:hypothetical protein
LSPLLHPVAHRAVTIFIDIVDHCVVAIIINFVARRPIAIVVVVVVVVVAHLPSLLSPVATKAIIITVACRAVIIVVDVVVCHAVAIIIESVAC